MDVICRLSLQSLLIKTKMISPLITLRLLETHSPHSVINNLSKYPKCYILFLTSSVVPTPYLVVHVHSLIHSFWRLILRLFRTLLLRGAPSPVMAKEEGLEGDVQFGRGGHQQGTQLNIEIIPCRWAHNRKCPSLHNS